MPHQHEERTLHPMADLEDTPNPKEPRYDAQNRRLCTAHRRDGNLCNKAAMNLQRVCRLHGGNSPQAKNKARLRLMDLVDPAIATLAREMATQTNSSADKQRAANSLLDRAGLGRVQRVEVADAKELLIEKLIALRDEGVSTEETDQALAELKLDHDLDEDDDDG